MSCPIILMRPGGANAPLVRALAALGARAQDLWQWPAYEFLPPDDLQTARQSLAQAASFDLVLLTSPAAVRAAARLMPQLPAGIRLAAAGSGTAAAIAQAWGGADAITPEGGVAGSGSEALWEILSRRGLPGRTLILRGDTGREWLAEKLLAAGKSVVRTALYRRKPLALSPSQVQALGQATAGPAPRVFLTSSDSVAILLKATEGIRGAHEWLLAGQAFTIHARISGFLESAGFAHPRLCSAEPQAAARALLDLES